MQRVSTTGSEESPRLVVDRVSVGIPARRFRIRATIAYETVVPPAFEFVLRLVRVVGTITVDSLQRFFGFSSREVHVLLSDLVALELIAYVGDNVQLGAKGRRAFANGSDDDPRINAVSEIDPVVAFDRGTFAHLPKLPHGERPSKSLVTLPVSGDDRASEPRQSAERAFIAFSRQILQSDSRIGQSDRKMFVYSVNEVIPRRPYTHEVSFPVVLSADCTNCEIDFRSLYEADSGSRRELVSRIAEYVRRLRDEQSSSEESLQFISRVSRGALLPLRGDKKTYLAGLVSSMSMWSDSSDVTTPLVGSLTSDSVREILKARLKEGDSENTARLMYWLRPGSALWGRSAVWADIFSEASETWARGLQRVLLSRDSDSITSRQASQFFQLDQAKNPNGFVVSCCFAGQSFPKDLELIIRPREWVVALGSLDLGDENVPVSVGLVSTDRKIVDSFASEVHRHMQSGTQGLKVVWNWGGISHNDLLGLMEEDLNAV